MANFIYMQTNCKPSGGGGGGKQLQTQETVRFVVMSFQERIAKAHGSQCGFCTPGMVMSTYALLRNKPQPTMDDITQALAGVFTLI